MKPRINSSDALRAPAVALLAFCLVGGAIPSVEASASPTARGAVAGAASAAGGRVVVHAEGQGTPWLPYGDGTTVETVYRGLDKSGGGLGEARSLAVGDFDEDGVADLAATYAVAGGGSVVLHSGNVASIYPNGPQAAGKPTDSPFLAGARAFAAPVAPDLSAAGDFDADGHLDLVVAAKGGDALHFMRGTGGGFELAAPVALPGPVTALAAGESRRGAGVGAVAVSVSSGDAGSLLVFEGPQGAMSAEAVVRELPAPASQIAFAHLDGDGFADVAVAAGDSLVLVSGTGEVARRDLGSPVSALAAGNFAGTNRPSLAVLASDGTVSVISAPRAGGLDKVGGWAVERVATGVDPSSRIAGASIASADDLVVIDPAARSLRVLSAGREATLSVDGAPVAVAPMRLNGDKVSDLVVLASGHDAPVAVVSKLRVTLTVTTAADSGAGSLRDAITTSNASVGVVDTIEFMIPGVMVHTIALASPLPSITDPVVIDGSTQTGFGGVPLIDLNGAGAGAAANGFTVTAGGTVIRSLIIRNFTGDGVRLAGNGNSDVEGCYIGTNAAGTADNGNGGFGVAIVNSTNNTVGGTFAVFRNVISGNSNGVGIAQASATGNVVAGNFIGTSVGGAAAIGNDNDGVVINAAGNNTIGGTGVGARNVISGNDDNGVQILGAGAAANAVVGNFIGPDVSGAVPLGNTNNGVLLTGVMGNSVGSTTPAGRNVISGNGNIGDPGGSTNAGIRIFGGGTNVVVGNFVGIDVSGGIAVPNIGNGVLVIGGSTNNVVGGVTVGARNVISGNTVNGVEISTAMTGGNVVLGNFIGTDTAGILDVGNTGNGVLILNASSNTVGGTAPGAPNVISGNNQVGVEIIATGPGTANDNNVLGNFIGLSAVSTSLGNAADGVRTVGSANSNSIGGTGAGAGNRIAANGGDGVAITGGVDNSILGNSITNNAGLGIDLGPNLVTANDAGDADTGANDLQNFPVLTSVTTGATSTVIMGTLDSTPSTSFRVEFFSSASCDDSGNGEGATFEGAMTVTTDATGAASFTFTATPAIQGGAIVTATATSPSGDTSEFSPCTSSSQLPTANLLVTVTDSPDPVRSGEEVTYTVSVLNLGPENANGVVLTVPTPAGTTYASATTGQGTITAPTPGTAGTVTVTIGTIAPNNTVTVTVTLNVTAPAGADISFAANATTTSSDPDTANNVGTATTSVIEAIVPPDITSVQFLSDPFRVRLRGTNFQPGITVFIGASQTPWPNYKYKDSTQLTLKKGAELRALFPKGVPTQIRVVNIDGGEDVFTVTR